MIDTKHRAGNIEYFEVNGDKYTGNGLLFCSFVYFQDNDKRYLIDYTNKYDRQVSNEVFKEL